jgi:hypothetical protein
MRSTRERVATAFIVMVGAWGIADLVRRAIEREQRLQRLERRT